MPSPLIFRPERGNALQSSCSHCVVNLTKSDLTPIVALVAPKKIGTIKIDDQGLQCMMVGHALGHSRDCYRM